MMTKYIKTALWSLAAVTFISSCNVMDTEPFESYSEDLVWGSFKTADAFVVQTYPNVLGYFAGNSQYWEEMTPNGARADQVNNTVNTIATETGIDRYTDFGFSRFSTMRRCNMIINKATTSSVFTEGERDLLLGEGHFLRGALFFDMARKMGRFVPITTLLEPGSPDVNTPLTANEAESYRLIMADLDIACEKLPETAAAGRLTKYAALLIRSRAALQAYAYTMDESYLDVAINSATAVINSGQYSLATNYGSMFNNDDPYSNEIILARYYLDTDATVRALSELMITAPNLPQDEAANGSADGQSHLSPTSKTFDGWAEVFPTQDLIDQFLMIDAATGEAVEWYEASQITENMTFESTTGLTKGSVETFTRFDNQVRHIPTPGDVTTDRHDVPLFTYNMKVKDTSTQNFTELFYSNRDARLDDIVVRDNTEYQGEQLSLNMGGNASQGVRIQEEGGWYTTTTGYYWRKNTVTPEPRVYESVKINYHYTIARLGEAYLNLAEAQLLKGNVGAAVTALNETRTKHGELPPSTATTLADAWADYIRERRADMVFENGDNYFSYLRWGKYGGHSNFNEPAGSSIVALGLPVHKISITSDRSQALIGQLTLLQSENRVFSTKRYLFPIPQGSIDSRSAFGITDVQNTGW